MMILESVLFLLAAALIPPLVLLLVIYRMDKIEREPPAMLVGLFIRGVLAMFPILILELAAESFVDQFNWSYYAYLFLAYFCIPGFIEEGVKYKVLVKAAWMNPNFNYRFDAVVYAVFVSLGFAAVENVLYVLTSGFTTAVMRAVFSIPGHAMFGVVMGTGVGLSKWLEAHGQHQQAKSVRGRAWLKAAVLHGLYDFLLMGFGGLFYIYFVLIVIYVYRLLKRSAREDGPIF